MHFVIELLFSALNLTELHKNYFWMWLKAGSRVNEPEIQMNVRASNAAEFSLWKSKTAQWVNNKHGAKLEECMTLNIQ